MNELSSRNFGLLIAYVLPGLVILFGVSVISPTAQAWLMPGQITTGPSVGGFLYAFLFSVASGVTISAVRWLVLDRILQRTGVPRPQLDLRNLEGRFHSFERVVQYHYRYYEFYGGMLFASCISYGIWRLQRGTWRFQIHDLFFLAIEFVFAAASRDALRNYYGRAAQVLGTIEGEVSHDERCRPSRSGSDRDEPETTGEEGSREPKGERAEREGSENRGDAREE